ncbi:DUF1428 domain-containing protein [Ningiella sp. W23]|uniref:DUF1428 domain-containing protein n=1 Tax=Ningiella sp. W23 TaxID=3023715 RepID=UPI0037574FAD
MAYVDGFLLAVPKDKKAEYTKMAKTCLDIWKEEYGLLAGKECWGDDVPDGEHTSFPMAVKLEEGENVVFSWTIWPDKETRNNAWAKCQEDERFKNMDMAFDGKRMMWGGFEVLIEV